MVMGFVIFFYCGWFYHLLLVISAIGESNWVLVHGLNMHEYNKYGEFFYTIVPLFLVYTSEV